MKPSRDIRSLAKTLFRLAEAQGLSERLRGELNAMTALFDACPEWRLFVGQLALGPARRQALLRELFESRAHPLLLRFLLAVNGHGYLRRLPDIAREFDVLYRRSRGIVDAAIVSAAPLDDGQALRLRDRLAARLGGAVETTLSVDPALLGGFLVRVGDEVRDFSVAARLRSMRRALAPA